MQRSSVEWVCEAVALLALAAILFTVISAWSDLPARIPMHFNAAGQPNGWGGKAGVLLLPGVSLFLYSVMTLASFDSRLVNIPMQLDRSDPRVQALLRQLTIVLKAVILLTFFYLVRATVGTALHRTAGLGRWFLPACLGSVLGVIVIYMRRLSGLQR